VGAGEGGGAVPNATEAKEAGAVPDATEAKAVPDVALASKGSPPALGLPFGWRACCIAFPLPSRAVARSYNE